MVETCESFFRQTVQRVETVIKDRYPEAVAAGEERFWTFAEAEQEPLVLKLRSNQRELDEHWANGNLPQMKQFCTEWGRNYLELYRLMNLQLRREAA
jgi:hypothetical protein